MRRVIAGRSRVPWRQVPVAGVILALALAGAGALGCGGGGGFDPDDVPPPVVFPEAYVVLHQEATNPDIEVNEEGDSFGSAIAVGDFDCDGVALDVAISMPGEAVNTGGGLEEGVGAVAVFIYDDSLETEMPFAAGPLLLRDDITTIGDVKEHDRFGYALAAGRINNGTCDDLIIGIPGADGEWEDQGAVQVRYGGSLTTSGVELAVLTEIDESQDGDDLGWSLAVGDFDHDGFADFGVGAPDSRDPEGDEGGGRVFVCYGASGGLGTGQDITETCEYFDSSEISEPVGADLTRFGWALAAGNFDADDYDDLAIGAPAMADGENGAVYLRPGADGGLLDEDSEERFASVGSPDPDEDEAFGYALATGDIQNDGAADLVIGAPRSEGGRVDIIGPAITDLDDLPLDDMPTDIEESFSVEGLDMGEEDECESCPFGEVLATADVNGDGLGDVAVGVPRPLSEISGFVAIRFGAPVDYDTPTREDGYVAVFQAPADEDVEGDQLGFALAALDLAYQGTGNGSGFVDLAMAAATDDVEEVTDTGIVLITRPEVDTSCPLNGVYQGTAYHNDEDPPDPETTSELRLYIECDPVAGEGTLRLFVWEDSLHLELDDCGGYTEWPLGDRIDQWIAAPRDVASSGSFNLEGTAIGGSLTRTLRNALGEVIFTIDFVGEASDLSGGSYQQIDIEITEVGLDPEPDDPPDWYAYEECEYYNVTEVTFYRVNPLWEP